MAAWLNHWETRDPSILLEQKEARTCQGCIHASRLWQQFWCLKKDQPAKHKCTKYREAE